MLYRVTIRRVYEAGCTPVPESEYHIEEVEKSEEGLFEYLDGLLNGYETLCPNKVRASVEELGEFTGEAPHVSVVRSCWVKRFRIHPARDSGGNFEQLSVREMQHLAEWHPGAIDDPRRPIYRFGCESTSPLAVLAVRCGLQECSVTTVGVVRVLHRLSPVGLHPGEDLRMIATPDEVRELAAAALDEIDIDAVYAGPHEYLPQQDPSYREAVDR